jgi:hypothetical protein
VTAGEEAGASMSPLAAMMMQVPYASSSKELSVLVPEVLKRLALWTLLENTPSLLETGHILFGSR